MLKPFRSFLSVCDTVLYYPRGLIFNSRGEFLCSGTVCGRSRAGHRDISRVFELEIMVSFKNCL